ncbi:hypothetical protein GYMLUDRAFT_50058 [Collybiopsis luxurians FD-317 M1]|uniref:Unplaced genomic scaffold GYMLUscaffold_99, whole genome shotgun sequence n=1 Tax=Collybiopsis luxurians FD-317 M1 TaxID=944289 RepID=A0A0D0C2X9_9AGAR|nr:hypothetical protein GYMLUDRAFT_50058 [Collybiopsis luxurians FD-317 M1]
MHRKTSTGCPKTALSYQLKQLRCNCVFLEKDKERKKERKRKKERTSTERENL